MTEEEQKAAADKAAAEAAAKAAADKAAADKAAADEKTVSAEYAARLRREAEEARKEAQALKAEKEERERAELEKQKEFEKLAQHERSKREAAERDAQERVTQAERKFQRAKLESLASKHGLLDFDDVDKLDLSKISWDEHGRALGADEAFEELKGRKPHYFKVENASVTGTTVTSKAISTPPPINNGTGGTSDAYALSDEEFERQYATLGRHVRA